MNEQYVVCRLCGEKFSRIASRHLVFVHDISMLDYRLMFPSAELVSEGQKHITSKSLMCHEVSFETRQAISDANTGHVHTVEAKQAMSIAHTGMKLSEEAKQKLSDLNSGKVFDEEFCRKVSEGRRGCAVSEETRRKISRTLTGRTSSEETKHKISEGLRGHKNALGCTRIQSEETKQKISQVNTGRTHSKEARKKMSESLARNSEERGRKISKALVGNTNALGHTFVMSEKTKREIAEGNTGKVHSAESIKQMSETRKKLWKDPEYARSVFRAVNRRPNESELHLLNILDRHYPNEWKYVGDSGSGIGGRYPDFVNINSKKQVIEMFGTYWHDPVLFPERPTEEELIAHYKECGFDCLVIWEYDVWDEASTLKELNDFCRKYRR